ncbi:procathepsin L-like isoform X2 [Tachyglossus aculeatus]|uniref:procathepsin L-like isoform X2 n=1 Tax=Tachyglossus aculeatus TaxID=9261 RepID=UPI0018F4543D|nr:procathepsin L-like isoform X2 [Tachyglossus aculeatus]
MATADAGEHFEGTIMPWLTLILTLPVLMDVAGTSDLSLDEGWWRWKVLHRKNYSVEAEEVFRRATWERNWRAIERHNEEMALGKHSYRLAMNHFGDQTNEELHKRLNGFRPNLGGALRSGREQAWFRSKASWEGPKEVDWRMKGYVTPVKNQGLCGSCWAFSATGALEALVFKATGKMVSLSEQNLVDCSWKQGNVGCRGGQYIGAFEYVRANGGIDAEDLYPYVGRDDISCRYSLQGKAGNCTSYMMVAQDNEQALEQAVATVGPVSVAVDARSFFFYHSGIFSSHSCTPKVNHAMLVVGYGTSKEPGGDWDYWILKNSWSERWGEQGYMRLLKGANNHCGVASIASFPVL